LSNARWFEFCHAATSSTASASTSGSRQTERVRSAAGTPQPSSARASWNKPPTNQRRHRLQDEAEKEPFLLFVSCFKPNFCQNRHIASLVFLPHTGKCYSVSRAFPIDPSIYPPVCKVGRHTHQQQQETFLMSTSLQISLVIGRISFLHQILISIRLIGIQSLINIHLVSFKILHQLEIPVPRRTFALPASKEGQKRGKWRDVRYIRKRSPTKCPAQKTAERREKDQNFGFSRNPARYVAS
jgi:hypothetical protein